MQLRTCATGVATLFLLLSAAGAAAQPGTAVNIPVPELKLPPSPRGTAQVQVGGAWAKTQDGGQRYEGGKWISIDYGRPILRGRQNIFGSGAEYGKTISDGGPVWRAGANETTRLTTQATLEMGGRTIGPGVYNVFVELKEGAWTLVLSNQPVQPKYDPNDKVNLYGSYNYDPKFDLLRAPMTVDVAPVKFEQFTIDFVDVSHTGGTLLMIWENTVAMVPFTAK
jgi:hypothetical protein